MVVILGQYRNRLLQNNRPVIEILIHEVHSAARNLHSVLERLLLRAPGPEKPAAAKDEYSGCDWETAARTTATAGACNRPGKPDRPCALQRRHDFAVMLFANLAFRRNHQSVEPAPPRRFDSRAASALLEITTAIFASSLPDATLSAIASKLEPRPESRMPKVFHGERRRSLTAH